MWHLTDHPYELATRAHGESVRRLETTAFSIYKQKKLILTHKLIKITMQPKQQITQQL